MSPYGCERFHRRPTEYLVLNEFLQRAVEDPQHRLAMRKRNAIRIVLHSCHELPVTMVIVKRQLTQLRLRQEITGATSRFLPSV